MGKLAWGGGDSHVVKVNEISSIFPSMGNLEHTVTDLAETLKSYYKVSRKRFVDTVCMQGCDYHLLTGDDTPLHLFSPKFVSELTPEQLETIAGEEASVKRIRQELKEEIAIFEHAKKVLRG